MFSISQLSQLFFHGLTCLTTTVALSTYLITSTTATQAQNQDLHNIKQKFLVAENNNVVQSGNISFNLQTCQRMGQSKTVSCQLLFTATSEDEQRISIYGGNKYGGSRVFDLSGNEYTATFAQIGKSKSTDIYNGEVRNELIPGIPTKAIINFELPTDITQLAALQIKYNNTREAVFRNVNIITANNTVKPKTPSNRKK